MYIRWAPKSIQHVGGGGAFKTEKGCNQTDRWNSEQTTEPKTEIHVTLTKCKDVPQIEQSAYWWCKYVCKDRKYFTAYHNMLHGKSVEYTFPLTRFWMKPFCMEIRLLHGICYRKSSLILNNAFEWIQNFRWQHKFHVNANPCFGSHAEMVGSVLCLSFAASIFNRNVTSA